MLLQRLLRKLKRVVRFSLGWFICRLPFFEKYKLHLLSTWHDYNKRSAMDNYWFPCLFEAWIPLEYLREKNPDTRERLKGLAMGGNSGKLWAMGYDQGSMDLAEKVGHLTIGEARPIYQEVERLCRDSSNDLVVIQIGSSSGKEIAYYAANYPHQQYIGVDIYEEVIAYAASAHPLKNLSFRLCSAKAIASLLTAYQQRKVLLFSSGSLQYVQPEHLSEFFDAIHRHANAQIVLCETANESQGAPDQLKKSLWRGNFAYSHDYKHYAEQAGIHTVACQIIRPFVPYEDFPMHRNTVHYFYHGKSHF
ncbi:MAG: methyltransferase domain-containing protein [Ignavibacteriae bacterium]|nr:methyltransferase domain-containing protein [Ignavibacteriota bacterium]